jgi:hypothetical protein
MVDSWSFMAKKTSLGAAVIAARVMFGGIDNAVVR